MFTGEHYRAIAETINATVKRLERKNANADEFAGVIYTEIALTNTFKEDNSNFNPTLFKMACYVGTRLEI